MKNVFKGLPESTRQTALAVFPLLALTILFVIVGKFGVSKVISIRSEIDSATKTETVLTQKLNSLQSLTLSVASKANIATSALPETNPALKVVSQLKKLANENGLVLSGIKSTSSQVTTSTLHEASVFFTIEGNRSQIFTFLNGIATIAPITVIGRTNITELVGSYKADVAVKSYWMELPSTIPSVTTPVADFSASDKEILAKISNLVQPMYVEIAPSPDNLNSSPFGQ